MTKSELIERLWMRAPHLQRRDLERIVTVIFEELKAGLIRGDRIELRGFGSFTIKHRQARDGRNPRTGERVAVPGKATPHFKCGRTMLERLNRTPVDAAAE